MTKPSHPHHTKPITASPGWLAPAAATLLLATGVALTSFDRPGQAWAQAAPPAESTSVTIEHVLGGYMPVALVTARAGEHARSFEVIAEGDHYYVQLTTGTTGTTFTVLDASGGAVLAGESAGTDTRLDNPDGTVARTVDGTFEVLDVYPWIRPEALSLVQSHAIAALDAAAGASFPSPSTFEITTGPLEDEYCTDEHGCPPPQYYQSCNCWATELLCPGDYIEHGGFGVCIEPTN